MKALAKILAALVLLFTTHVASAQTITFNNVRIASTVHTHTTVGTSAAAAISSGSVSSKLVGWEICNDAVNTSTYLFVGLAADPSTDGIQLGKGVCYACPNCVASLLKSYKVIAQAASNGYSVTQFVQQ